MAEDADQDSKTEEPTPKRLEESRQKGQTGKSQEVNSWFTLLLLAVLIVSFLPIMGQKLIDLLRMLVMNAHMIDLTGHGIVEGIRAVMTQLVLLLMVLMILAVIGGIAGTVLQIGWLFAPESIIPKPQKINPISGLKRLFSMRSVVEFLKGLFKISIVAAITVIIIYPDFDTLSSFVSMDLFSSMSFIRDEAFKMMVGILFVVTIIALLDVIYQRYEYTKGLRMTRQEVKDENKQSEGDPQIKGRIRSLRMQRARQRMMAAVPNADVVVTNPTHYAVALKYDQSTMAAPILVAKGVDLVAKRIRDLAEENDVPIMSNPPLARALHAGVELDKEVPEEHYHAVAEVISYVMRLKEEKNTRFSRSHKKPTDNQ